MATSWRARSIDVVVVAVGGGGGGELAERLRGAVGEALPFDEDVVGVVPRQQVAAVAADRGVEIAGVEGAGELDDVDTGRGVGAPSDLGVGDVDVGLDVGQGATEVVEEVAEVGAGLGVGGVGPERVGEGRAVDRRAGLEHESGHELDEARGVERVDGLAVGADGGLAEQADLEPGVGRHVSCLARIVA